YIISALIILIAWMDIVYASAVLIWPPTALQAGLIFLLAVAEIVMVQDIQNLPIWVVGCGLVTIVGGITRCNNFRIFKKEDFEEPVVGSSILRNELIYGLVYIVLGLIGVGFGLYYDPILAWVAHNLSSLDSGNPDAFLHWVTYVDLMA